MQIEFHYNKTAVYQKTESALKHYLKSKLLMKKKPDPETKLTQQTEKISLENSDKSLVEVGSLNDENIEVSDISLSLREFTSTQGNQG